MQMPHESTVAHEQRFTMESPMIARSRTYSVLDQTVVEEETEVLSRKVIPTWSNFSISVCLFNYSPNVIKISKILVFCWGWVKFIGAEKFVVVD